MPHHRDAPCPVPAACAQFVGGGYYAYTHFQGVTNRTGYYIVAVATACIIWNPKDLLKPMLWITVPGYIVHSSWGIIYRFDMRHPGSPGCFALRKVMFAGQAFVLFVTLCICGCRIQRYSGMAGFAVMYMVINFLLIGFMVICERSHGFNPTLTTSELRR
jgi:hypothetical protein